MAILGKTDINGSLDVNGSENINGSSKIKGSITTNDNIKISHAASENMSFDSTNPSIEFSENGSQPVKLMYTDYDNYRPPAGLKVIGNQNECWLEVQGKTYSSGFVKSDGTGNNILLDNGTTKDLSSFYYTKNDRGYEIISNNEESSKGALPTLPSGYSWKLVNKEYVSDGPIGGFGGGSEDKSVYGNLFVSKNITASGDITAATVHGAVWNDLVDKIIVPDDTVLEYGKCYYINEKKYELTNKYCQNGIIGIHSDTAGFSMGNVENKKQLNIAVAGFVLAYTDKKYPSGTPLTCTKNGYLTKISFWSRIMHPERIVGTYWKNEFQEEWNGIKVNNRNWIKIK